MKIIFCFALLLCSTPIFSQDQQAVTLAATDYIDAFYFGDTLKLKRSVSPAVIKYGYYRVKDKTNYEGEPMSFQEMLDYATRVNKRNKPEAAAKFVKEVQVLDVQNKTACAKVKAWWGTDYLLMTKLDDKWVITHVLWQSYPAN